MRALKRGDMIRRIGGDGESYLVESNRGDSIVAARSWSVTDEEQWVLPPGGLARLQVGDVIACRDGTGGYVVMSTGGIRVTAMKAIEISEPGQWLCAIKVEYGAQV